MHGIWEMSLNNLQKTVLSLDIMKRKLHMDALDDAANDTSCGLEEEGKTEHEMLM